MILYLCVLIVFSLHRESLKLILVDEPLPEVVLSQFHSMIKVIHLALEVKTSFDNSTPVTGSSTESSSSKPVVPTDSRQ
jgi:hypothetical protein